MATGPTGRVERRLAAILTADVAGYSRLMGANEDAADRSRLIGADEEFKKRLRPSCSIE